jgi:hypothetical protein
VVGRERQVDAEADRSIAAHHDRPVMPRGVRIEEGEQQRLADPSVQEDPSLQMALERGTAGEHEQCSPMAACQLRDGPHENVHEPGRGPMGADTHPPATDLLEEAPQVVLKDDDDDHDRQRHEALEHPGGELEAQLSHEQGRADQQHQADQDQTRARAQPAKPRPDHGGHEQHVQQVDDA